MNTTLENGAVVSVSCIHVDFPEGVIDKKRPWWEQVDPMMKKFSKWIMDQCGVKIMVFDSIASGVAITVDCDMRETDKLLDAIAKFDFTNWRNL